MSLSSDSFGGDTAWIAPWTANVLAQVQNGTNPYGELQSFSDDSFGSDHCWEGGVPTREVDVARKDSSSAELTAFADLFSQHLHPSFSSPVCLPSRCDSSYPHWSLLPERSEGLQVSRRKGFGLAGLR